MFSVIIAGSRDFDDFNLLRDFCDVYLRDRLDDPIQVNIISGTARGADKVGESYCANRGCNLIRKPANWDKYGRSAGYRRNEEMAEIANACIVFWDGTSPGTKNMIDICKKRKIPCKVVKYLELKK